jgi:hypothetical protein
MSNHLTILLLLGQILLRQCTAQQGKDANVFRRLFVFTQLVLFGNNPTGTESGRDHSPNF